MTIDEAINFASQKLNISGIPEPRREASLLLGYCIDKDRAFIISHNSAELTEREKTKYISLIERREKAEPFHYITGEKEFYGLLFKVDRSVLIPRPETEMLVEAAIEFLSPLDSPSFCEIGVGSGCISVSILRNVNTAKAVAGDVSEAALDVVIKNAGRHSVTDRLNLFRSDVFENIPKDNFDLIVSNPPYVPAEDIGGLEKDVRDFEPHTALTDGGSGFSILEQIISNAPQYLRSGGKIMLEFGIGQAETLRACFELNIWRDVQIKNDLRSIPRNISAELK